MIKQRIDANIEEEIQYISNYLIIDAMRELGQLGFMFEGRGVGAGMEDYGLANKDFYVVLYNKRNKISISVYDNDDTMNTLFQGTVGRALQFIKKSKRGKK